MRQLTFNPLLTLTGFQTTRPRGSFLERPGNLTGPKSYFEIKVSRNVGRVVTSNEVNFVSLGDTLLYNFQTFWNYYLEWKTKLPNGLKLFCFPFQMGVSKLLKIIQLSFQLKKQSGLH